VATATPFDRYVDAWNAGDLDRWLEVHDRAVEYVSLAGPEPRVYRGHVGLRDIWAESRGNWLRFAFAIVADEGELVHATFSGIEHVGATELGGALWFRVQTRGGRIVALWSALDPELLRAG